MYRNEVVTRIDCAGCTRLGDEEGGVRNVMPRSDVACSCLDAACFELVLRSFHALWSGCSKWQELWQCLCQSENIETVHLIVQESINVKIHAITHSLTNLSSPSCPLTSLALTPFACLAISVCVSLTVLFSPDCHPSTPNRMPASTECLNKYGLRWL